jgi:hypothetical protein
LRSDQIEESSLPILILFAHRIVPRESSGVVLQSDRMDESELLSMQRPDPYRREFNLSCRRLCRGLQSSSSETSSATLHPSPPGLSSSTSTAVGCKRARGSDNDSNSVTAEEEINSGERPVAALGGHGLTRR